MDLLRELKAMPVTLHLLQVGSWVSPAWGDSSWASHMGQQPWGRAFTSPCLCPAPACPEGLCGGSATAPSQTACLAVHPHWHVRERAAEAKLRRRSHRAGQVTHQVLEEASGCVSGSVGQVQGQGAPQEVRVPHWLAHVGSPRNGAWQIRKPGLRACVQDKERRGV